MAGEGLAEEGGGVSPIEGVVSGRQGGGQACGAQPGEQAAAGQDPVRRGSDVILRCGFGRGPLPETGRSGCVGGRRKGAVGAGSVGGGPQAG
ncbi:hypothetical protein GCM10012289_62180 [Nonomuraea cavernae]|uniref:Uncharacterized protein n=1 Tax=Nonomuraea cavernae TaxID=2045107 RepID=A0A918DRI2_9ACTN|nr:hypothetical protein GCM10012289_62180 [Nonomuraea cavernae]